MKTSLSSEQIGGWPTASLESLCINITSGGTPKRLTAGYYTDKSGVPWVRTQELQDRVLVDTAEHITERAIEESSAKRLPKGTLLMAMYAAPTAGRMAILGREMACNQAACAFVFDSEKADTRYMFYQLLHARPDLHRLANGAAQQNLSARVLRQLEVVVPPLDEQRRIAHTLGAIDDLIEVNRGLIRNFDELGLSILLNAMPRAMASIDGAATQGWTLTTIGDGSAVVETGRRPKGGVASISAGVPSIGAESIVGLARFDFSKTKYVDESFFDSMKSGHVESGDVLVYKDGGTPGNFIPKVGMFGEGFPFDKMAINEHVFRVRMMESSANAFLYFWLRSPRMLAEMHRSGTGAAIPGINRTAFCNLPVPVPPADIAPALHSNLQLFAKSALKLALEIRQLEQTRDELLSLLLSGKVRVGEDVAA